MTAFAADDYTLHRPRWNDVHLEDSRDYHDDHDYLFFDDDPAISYEINIRLRKDPDSEKKRRIIRDTYTISEGRNGNEGGLVALYNNNTVNIVHAMFSFLSRGEIRTRSYPKRKGRDYISHLNEVPLYPSVVLFPIDKRMKVKDILYATKFYPNEDNTGWLFSHSSQNVHRDFEYNITSALDSIFWKERDLIQDEADSKLYSLLVHGNTSDRRSTWGDSTRRLDVIRQFHSEVELEALKIHKSNHLGYYIQNPHVSSVHEVLTKSLRKVKAKWEADNDVLAAWLSIKDIVSRLIERTSILYQYKTRWDIAAEAEAESEEN